MQRLLKRIRQRFGISAPKMTVRTHVAWYWRWLGMLVFLSFSLALAAWMYDAGRRFAGFDHDELENRLTNLRESMSQLESEAARLRAIANASDSRLKIEQTAQAQLAAQVRSLEDENTRLKEDLAFFENLMPSDHRDKVSIHRFTVERDVLPGEYRYRLLVLQGGKLDREFHGSLQLVVEMQRDGKDVTIVIPQPSEAGNPDFKLNFKYFRRIEGTFRVPAGAKVRTIQARILESGSDEARASQNVNLS